MCICLTCHHKGTHTLHSALHGSFHQSGEAVAVSPLDVQPRVVVQQIVGDGYVTFKNTITVITVGTQAICKHNIGMPNIFLDA